MCSLKRTPHAEHSGDIWRPWEGADAEGITVLVLVMAAILGIGAVAVGWKEGTIGLFYEVDERQEGDGVVGEIRKRWGKMSWMRWVVVCVDGWGM